MKKAVELLLTNIANLFKVKTILSLTVITVTAILALNKTLEIAAWMGISTAIITYYFTKDDKK